MSSTLFHSAPPHWKLSGGFYAEREEPNENAFDRWTRAVLGSAFLKLRPFRSQLHSLVRDAAAESEKVAVLDDETLVRQIREYSRAAVSRSDLAPGLAPGLARAREAASRSLELRPFDTQLMGAATLMAGKLAEMQTGEGKTLTAALAAGMVACAGTPVHVITVNDYLAARDAEILRPFYTYLGLRVGVVTSGMPPEARRRAYARDVTYCTNKELVFDYLKDRVAVGGRVNRAQIKVRSLLKGEERKELLLRGLHFAIVDEADSTMIDEARTPLILAAKGPNGGDSQVYEQALALSETLSTDRHFRLSEARRELHLTEEGRAFIRARARELGGVWLSVKAREQLAVQALRARLLFHRDQHYLLSKDRKIRIIDEYTGRVLEGRTWEQGLHQMIEAKEHCLLSEHNKTLARITYQRFFRRYLTLSGMTGTASEVGAELHRVYGLEVVTIPTHRPSQRANNPHVCCPDEVSKWRRVAEEVGRLREKNLPVLIGTRSLEASERLSRILSAAGLHHRVLNARQDAEEAAIVAEAGQSGKISVATNMAGRGTDIRLEPGVAQAGGLHVILTEFHDSPRIDRQLIGRCARQGEPGCSIMIVALDDPLLRQHGGRFRQFLVRGFPGQPPPWLVDLLRRHCQRAAERIHRRERRDTMKRDRELDSKLAFTGNTP